MRRELALGSVTLALSAAYYWVADTIPTTQLADAIGPQGLPKIYALLLAGLSLMLMVGSVRDSGSGIRDSKNEHRVPKPESRVPSPESRVPSAGIRVLRVLGMILIGVAYVVAAPWLGYPLSIAGLILATTYYQGGAFTRSVALVSLCGGVFFWLLFVVLMGIRQPSGWWN